VHCRGRLNNSGQSFRVGKKGDRTLELVNENRQQHQLFEYVASTPQTRTEPIQELVPNVWIIADASPTGRLAIYLAYPYGLERDSGANWAHMNLFCSAVRLLWEGPLFEHHIEVTDRPEAAEISIPTILDRDMDQLEAEEDEDYEPFAHDSSAS
jgi:hypothetical protein